MNRLIIKEFGKRNKILEKAGYKDYSEFLRSDTWKAIHELWEKKKLLGIRVWQHCFCCDTTRNLQLHHVKYSTILKIKLGSNIYPVCNGCHMAIHRLTQEHDKISIKTATKIWARFVKKKYIMSAHKKLME